ncbi:MAG: hypothetical protein SGPRY_007473 [Prymnesium sp.]
MAVLDAPPSPVLPDAITDERPLRVLIAGAGVGGLATANALRCTAAPVNVTVIERTSEFKRFGGPIQLASNAMQSLKAMDPAMYEQIERLATWTGNRTNGIKDGVRDEWYAKFDLKTPAKVRSMPYTCVVERPDLQEVLLEGCRGCSPVNPHTCLEVRNGCNVERFEQARSARLGCCLCACKPSAWALRDMHARATREGNDAGVKVFLEGGEVIEGDVLIGADGIWSQVRAQLRDEPARGDGSGVSYSGYTLNYDRGDPECGYKVYIGPNQYFVITDIAAKEPKPDGSSIYLQQLFDKWSPEIHDILKATQEHEIEQRDLYDRPPSVLKPWGEGRVTLLGDSVHAMMPNLGQGEAWVCGRAIHVALGGCQAIEDACVLAEELTSVEHSSEVASKLRNYNNRRLARSATVQGLSRFASDIIIQGFDTPFSGFNDPRGRNYNGFATRVMQPLLPIFFSIQFNFLYSGWRNERFALEPIKDFFVLAPTLLGLALVSLLLLVARQRGLTPREKKFPTFSFHVVGDLILGGELLEGIGAVFTGSSEVAGGSQVAEFFQPLTNLIEEISNSISSLF